MTTRARWRTVTTKLVERHKGGGEWDIIIPLAPTPASRPRVTRWGTYFPKKYSVWKEEAHRLLSEYTVPDLFAGRILVRTDVVCYRPKKPANDYPVGDIDNYEKATYDAITKAKIVWKDDVQIVGCETTKRYADGDEEPHTHIRIEKEK